MRDISLLYQHFQELLENTTNSSWSGNDKTVYWINAYNTYTVKLIIDSYPIKRIKDLKKTWDKKFIKIDEKWFSLDQLAHKILRKFGYPLIRFAINYASISCPGVWNRAYSGENLQIATDSQTEKFINNPTKNAITPYEVAVSKIFDWYNIDFKLNRVNVINFINRYSNIKIADQKEKGQKDYHWNLNEF
ncbi:DUF547 domain-containing protein [Aquimarina sp. M1]